MKKIYSITLFLLLLFKVDAEPPLLFDVSMSFVPQYQSPKITQNRDWQLLKELYENYDCTADQKDNSIPKIIHFIWLGSPLPERCEKMISSWRKFHPDWRVLVWTDEDAISFPFINRTAFDNAKNWGEKSDIWRYEILFREGGMYVDTDFECLKPFDTLHSSCEFYTGIGQTKYPTLLIGILGSRAGHPILKALIDNLREGPGDQDQDRIMNDTGPYHFTRIFLAIAGTFEKGTVVPFPVTFFYPFPGGERERKDQERIKEEYVLPETMAIHYFATSWHK